MKKLFSAVRALLPTAPGLCFYLCAGFFIGGCVLGVFLGIQTAQSSAAVAFLTERVGGLRGGTSSLGFFAIYLSLFAGAAASFLFAWCVPGVVLIPILCLVRGVSLTFSCCLISRMYGSGFLAPFAVIGPGAFLSLPIFLLTASASFSFAAALCRSVFSGRPELPRSAFLPFLLLFLSAAAMTALPALADKFLIPLLMTKFLSSV